jgi:hypothetical protein
MRDMNLQSPIKFYNDIENYIKVRIPKRIFDLRKLILDNPNFLNTFENNIIFKSKESETILALLFLSWYLPEEIGVLLRLEIEGKGNFNKRNNILKRIFIHSKENSLNFLYLSQGMHSREFFGNFLRKGLKELENLKFLRKKTKKIFKGDRKRGYQDHGSRRPDSKWLPSSDYSFTELQNKKEKEEIKFNKLIDRIQGKIKKNFLISQERYHENC